MWATYDGHSHHNTLNSHDATKAEVWVLASSAKKITHLLARISGLQLRPHAPQRTSCLCRQLSSR